MWILVTRAPRPDVAYWPGRRWLALVDAVAWPALLLWVIGAVPIDGVVRIVAVTVTIIFALRRVYWALFLNERYRFTTWRLGVAVTVILAIGLTAKLLLG